MGIRYIVGARVRVQVSRVDLDGRRIDFRMVREGEDDATRLRAKRERAVERNDGAAEELARVKATDRAVKAATKAKGRGGKTAHPVKAAKSTARKAAGSARGAKRR